MGIPEESILEILIEERVCNCLENLLCNNEEYQSAQSKLEEAVINLNQVGFNKKQDEMIDKTLSIANYCGAVYGALAYEQGLGDGIKLMIELYQKGRLNGIPEKGQ